MPRFEANEIVAQAGQLNKYVADCKRSYNTYYDGWRRTEDRVQLGIWKLFDKPKNCVVFTTTSDC